MKYVMYNTPSHAVLKVPIAELEALNIKDQISEFSFFRDDEAYLEEDRDLSIFVSALEKANKTIDWNKVKQVYTRMG